MSKPKVYVASSWRNELYPQVVEMCKELGFDSYDFRNPPGGTGFGWSQVAKPGVDWKNWTFEEYREALIHPISEAGFNSDMSALEEAEVCILVLPAGVSAALEFGYAVGAGKRTFIVGSPREAELMLKMSPLHFYAYNLTHLKEMLMSLKADLDYMDALEIEGQEFREQAVIHGLPA